MSTFIWVAGGFLFGLAAMFALVCWAVKPLVPLVSAVVEQLNKRISR